MTKRALKWIEGLAYTSNGMTVSTTEIVDDRFISLESPSPLGQDPSRDTCSGTHEFIVAENIAGQRPVSYCTGSRYRISTLISTINTKMPTSYDSTALLGCRE